ncbi:hypothetical protein KNU64_gp86 [Gordonia Phage Lollipop1437]|uniref:Uncharacterized protein n=1 Tax=Gordonia Phage Lollipop1437 TaxID=2588505 RepID=A0A4Y6EKD8_9CAUD|nr:hypothetical protein KNU64_gp86 [Gordonia Phage Lollipop1437]QDF19190.1 hypothetical protein SEA_LOLLIPOP1437_86 [Gordonia Phage Lollipop1437]
MHTTDRLTANRETIATVQATRGLTASERNVAGPAVADAREASRNGWTITYLDAYAMAVVDTDGDTVTAEYSRASNGVLEAHVTIGGNRRQIIRRNGVTLRQQVQSLIGWTAPTN